MRQFGLPHKQGLYDPQFEHDACGIGFVANIKGHPSHHIVEQALVVLRNLDHRGGQGAESNTGDGAGILMQIPHQFFQQQLFNDHVKLPKKGDYGIGMIFMPQDVSFQQQCESIVEEIVTDEGQSVLAWREVPTSNHEMLGQSARNSQPYVRQLFIERSHDIPSGIDFERKLYVIRKRIEHRIQQLNIPQFYVVSLSSKTIVYKGMLTPDQVDLFYADLKNPQFETAIALVHSRFSTNTFPSWERAHPYRYFIHNGEINTLRGNVNWMKARESMCQSDIFGEDLNKCFPLLDETGSDAQMFDNTLEFLHLSGRSLPHAAMMMIPEPWQKNEHMDKEKRDFYAYHSALMEPWDGPAAVCFSDGSVIGACLDRNGLRPARYYVTKDDLIVLSSEVGVLHIPEEDIVMKERLRPGKMLLVDTEQGRMISDEELKSEIASAHPYGEWLQQHQIAIEALPCKTSVPSIEETQLVSLQKAFGYTTEHVMKILKPMAEEGIEPTASMGVDIPLAVLSKKPQMLYSYFKQLFAQVTNPPIDAIREEIVTSSMVLLGAEGNLLQPTAASAKKIKLQSPVLSNEQLQSIRDLDEAAFQTETLSLLFDAETGSTGMKQALDTLFEKADEAVNNGKSLLILSDRGLSRERASIPTLLAASGLHHHLIRKGNRMQVSLIIESGEPREVHHFAVLLGFGADSINPYVAFETLKQMKRDGIIQLNASDEMITEHYVKATVKGIIKILSKMGISTIQSYQGAQIFEAIGISKQVIDAYFTGTASRIGGIDFDTIAKEQLDKHVSAYQQLETYGLESGGEHQWRIDGEKHLFSPETVHALQNSTKTNDYEEYKRFASLIDDQRKQHITLRSLMQFKTDSARSPIPIEEVESVEEICKRFKTGAMSFGSLSKEAHESLAIAMNRIGGKSNTGEGGEDPARFVADENGDLRRSAIKQVASGRFGVSSHYLMNADEIQIKIAQGAKPGEGGQLPAKKVYPWVAEVRGSTPGVGLISPPPHHDIYSIEDLAELIHDLKNANPRAKICVKLVSEVGVGTIAAGVAKGKADIIMISGFDGGTGASPRTSLYHTGLPWELGLAETHQTLMLNQLRDRVVLETDGKMLTGRDVIIAALLGAEEYGFSTAPLIALGCVMMRVCQKDTCPVGIATQNPTLRDKFAGDPDYVVNYLKFIAQHTRELMAELGFRTINEMVGRTDVLEQRKLDEDVKCNNIDLSPMFYRPDVPQGTGTYKQIEQDHKLDQSIDRKQLLDLCAPALDHKENVHAILPITNQNRVAGTIVGSEITKRYGLEGLPHDTIRIHFQGSAGLSFGAFVPKGMTLSLEGDANDYVGKGLSGGKVIVFPSEKSPFVAEENIIVGNVSFYGATAGEAYIRGIAGERFCVRNSGVRAVVEGVGDHACEYMTGGRVVILGSTGRNFAAGMSGGIAYVYDEDNTFKDKVNTEMVLLETLEEDYEINEVKQMIRNQVKFTGSDVAHRILHDWEVNQYKFVKVIPRDFKRMFNSIERGKKNGMNDKEAAMAAFVENMKEVESSQTKQATPVGAK
ncbi:glutamate synthase large subunit [Longirhabdus pacifica]|uniref:glutamate synthase large subunit n=1 Tax=Longirhabdus pacifica TaxID=2305227 RepID=UPI0010087FAE|nr:glutamate synthase large subunit [Longirhabdus pacifica]